MRKFKERILSFVLTFVMLVSLLTGMTPVEVQAAEEPTLDELKNTITSTFEATLTVGDEYIQCSELPTVKNENYKWVYCYIPTPSTDPNYEAAYEGYKSYLGSVLGGMMKNADMPHSEALDCLIVDMPEDLKIPVSSQPKSYGILCILQVYDYKWIDSDGTERYYFNQAAVFDVSRGGTVSNGLSGGGETPEPAVTITINKNVPESVVAWEGRISKELTVSATASDGSDLTYQWYERKRTGDVAISGATESTFTVPTDLRAGIYNYYCKITAGETQVDTNVAVVTIRPNTVMSLESWFEIDEKTGNYTITLPENMTEYYVSTTADVDQMNAEIGGYVTSDNYLNITRVSPSASTPVVSVVYLVQPVIFK